MFDEVLSELAAEVGRCEKAIDNDPDLEDPYMNRIQGLLFAYRIVYAWQKVSRIQNYCHHKKHVLKFWKGKPFTKRWCPAWPKSPNQPCPPDHKGCADGTKKPIMKFLKPANGIGTCVDMGPVGIGVGLLPYPWITKSRGKEYNHFRDILCSYKRFVMSRRFSYQARFMWFTIVVSVPFKHQQS